MNNDANEFPTPEDAELYLRKVHRPNHEAPHSPRCLGRGAGRWIKSCFWAALVSLLVASRTWFMIPFTAALWTCFTFTTWRNFGLIVAISTFLMSMSLVVGLMQIMGSTPDAFLAGIVLTAIVAWSAIKWGLIVEIGVTGVRTFSKVKDWALQDRGHRP